MVKEINIKKFLVYVGLFLGVFFISFIVTYVCMPVGCDDVWLYGFSYNISKGLVIYRDYNVITTPLYYFIGCYFIKLFGNYIISIGILNAMLVSFVVLMMYRIIKWKAFIVFPLILIFFPNGYNLFSLFWLMLIILLINLKSDHDYLMGFIIGLLFITKQSVGLVFLIPYLYYSKNKLKGLLCFLIPFMFVSVYLLCNNAFYEFIDYCFLGLFDFGANNTYYGIYFFVEIFVLIYLIFKLVKSKFKEKEVFYILCFQIVLYPIFDSYHFFVSFFPVMYYFIKELKNIYLLIILTFSVFYLKISLFLTVDFNINFEKDLLYLKNCGDLPGLMEDFNDYLEDEKYFCFISYYGYLYKLYYDIPINKYDLWNDGNMGYNGINESIDDVDEFCDNNKCLFIVDGNLKYRERNRKSQIYKVYDYVVNNYEMIEEYNTFYIYSNYDGSKNG